jgi:hypothetical protein
MAREGHHYRDKRLAEAIAFGFCDGLRLLALAAPLGGGFNADALYSVVLQASPRFSSAFSFSNGLGPKRLFVPGSVRDLKWDAACACFTYVGTTNHRL